MAARSKKKTANDETNDGTDASGGAGRSIWTGSISFGLLQIPVALHTAESRTEEIHFRQLDKKDLAPIKYERVSSKSGKAVAYKDIVKGYELKKAEFVVIEPEELAKANVKATQTLDIQDFVPFDDIEPAFFETPYYLVPQKRSEKAYVLLRDALAKKKAAAIATFVLRTREHLVAITPEGDALMACVLRFGHELKAPGELDLPGKTAKVTDRELAMAEQLIDEMMGAWDPKKYKDRHYADVMKIIREKAKHGVVKEHNTESKGIVASDTVDLLELLKRSVGQRGSANDANPSRKTATKKKKTAKRAGKEAA